MWLWVVPIKFFLISKQGITVAKNFSAAKIDDLQHLQPDIVLEENLSGDFGKVTSGANKDERRFFNLGVKGGNGVNVLFVLLLKCK